jgi:hypothetical protein
LIRQVDDSRIDALLAEHHVAHLNGLLVMRNHVLSEHHIHLWGIYIRGVFFTLSFLCTVWTLVITSRAPG